ncbi:uncharacterized protein LOC142336609 [Convolutriloba macropyga]|uniref:uncharacterized protein LOC142336609 n=1 Tax=Convolutriloba macropyga TaxID=536237 RepID=UPI003F52765E
MDSKVWLLSIVSAILFIVIRKCRADFLITQDQSRSNSSGITVCVRLDNPPGQLFRDNILAFNDLQDGCMFDTDYNSSGNGFNSSRNYTYTLEDNSGNLTENVLCTYTAEDIRFTNTLNKIFSRKLLAILTGKDAILKEVRDCVLRDDPNRLKEISPYIFSYWLIDE